ncbi:MAG: hypothetical protein Q9210_001334 [Variospora velana]
MFRRDLQPVCLPQDAVVGILYFGGALSAFTHTFLAFIPIFALWNIQIKPRTKAGICLLMSTTAITAIAAVVRTVHVGDPGLGTGFPYNIPKLVNWAIIEAALIIIAACIPSLRPFDFITPIHAENDRRRSYPLSAALALPPYQVQGTSMNEVKAGLQGSRRGKDLPTGLTEKSMQKEAGEAASQV